MNISFTKRNLYPNELRLLKTLKSQKEKEAKSKIKLYHFLIAGLLGAILTYLTSIIPDSFWTFLFGTVAVFAFAFAFIVFMPYEIYKQKNKHKLFLQQLNKTIENGTVETFLVNSKRIAFAPEFEDESDLYIIELNDCEVLYLWDYQYNLNKYFPCLEFEIYDEIFFKITERQLYPLSDKVQPIIIDKNVKWNYMKLFGMPDHIESDKIHFDELIKKINTKADTQIE